MKLRTTANSTQHLFYMLDKAHAKPNEPRMPKVRDITLITLTLTFSPPSMLSSRLYLSVPWQVQDIKGCLV